MRAALAARSLSRWPIYPQFPDVLLMGRQHGNRGKGKGRWAPPRASLRADAAKAVNRAYAKFGYERLRKAPGVPRRVADAGPLQAARVVA